MNNKAIKKILQNVQAFTLVELLAVIVILAIISLIIVPQVLNVIEKSQRQSFVNGTYQLIKAGQIYYNEKDMKGESLEKVIFEFPNNALDLDVNGKLPKSGSMVINEQGEIALAVSDGKTCLRKGFKEDKVLFDINTNDCYIYHDEELNGADPEIKDGMIPVVIENDGTVKKAHETSNWYSYSEKKWANVVTVTEESRKKYKKADVGTEIKEEDILTYFVWIPRYKYKLWYVEAQNGFSDAIDTSKVHSINIVFEDKYIEKSNGDENGEYLTHPAFTFGDEELNGIWVGKFETGYKGATSHATAQKSVIEPNSVLIKPNLYSWTGITISDAFYTTRGMIDKGNIFGIRTDSEPHVMKNTEWGAVAYLSHSKYGTCIDGVCTEVYQNNNGYMITSCGGDSPVEDKIVYTCKNKFGTNENGIYNQTTNKNITGVFDMSGGTSEHVMGYATRAITKYSSSGFTDVTFPEDKYLDLYLSYSNTDYSKRILGDATGELGPFATIDGTMTSSWYGDYPFLARAATPWFNRGNNYSGSSNSVGMFYFHSSRGDADGRMSFRIVIS